MATTALDILNRAASKIGVKIIGQALSTDQGTNFLAALNDMIEEWALENFLIYARSEDTHTLTASTASYTIGSSGDINTVRPQEIKEAFIRDSNGDDYYVDCQQSIDKYWDIVDKTQTGRPYQLFYNPDFASSLGKIYLYYTPDTAETLYIYSLKELGSFATTSTSVTLPPGYKNALVLNLAIDLADENGKTVSPSLMRRAEKAKSLIRSRNSKHIMKPTRLEVAELSSPNAGREMGNISTGWQ